MNDMGFKDYLNVQIEIKRNMMMNSAMKYGYTSAETIRYSQELDHLLNVYRRENSCDVEKNSLKERSVSFV